MISADEALDIAEKNRDYMFKKELAEIEKWIIEASNEGRFEFPLADYQFALCKSKLEELGYRFTPFPNYGKEYFLISWSRISKLEKSLK